MYAAALLKANSGMAYQSDGRFIQAEHLFDNCQFPKCYRPNVGSVNLDRRACCVGLSLSSRTEATFRPVIQSRSAELRALTSQMCSIIRQECPSSFFRES